MRFPYGNLPKEELSIVEVNNTGCITDNSLAISPCCKRKLRRKNFIWMHKGSYTYPEQLLWK